MDHPYQDASLTLLARTIDLLARMTLDEKLGQLHALWLLLLPDGEHTVLENASNGSSDPAQLEHMLSFGLG